MHTTLQEGRKAVLEMDKERLCLVLSKEAIRRFRGFIANKQEGQFKKGDLSKWAEISFNNLTAGYGAHAHSTQNTNPYQIPKGRLKIKNMMQDICSQYIQSGISQIPLSQGKSIVQKHLDKLIRDVTGHHDPRAIKRHIQDLMKYEYIKDVGYTGAFLILDTGTDIEYIERVMEQQKRDERNKGQNQHTSGSNQNQAQESASLTKQEQAEAIKQQEFDSVMEDLK